MTPITFSNTQFKLFSCVGYLYNLSIWKQNYGDNIETNQNKCESICELSTDELLWTWNKQILIRIFIIIKLANC